MKPAQTFLPVGRPYLLESTGELDLIYLSWGKRRYKESPIPVTPHEGWVYTIVLDGSPNLVFPDGKTRSVSQNQMVVCRPDQATGWIDARGKICDQLTWVWRNSPDSKFFQTRGCGIFSLTNHTIEQLRQNHQRCREEIAAADQFTARALKVLHESLQIAWSRSFHGGSERSVNRFEFAMAWLGHHALEEKAVTRLAEYLQISLSTLDRLFQKNIGVSAAAWIHAEKMGLAESLLKKGLPKKQVAYELRYRHACDFSRAWSHWRLKSKSR